MGAVGDGVCDGVGAVVRYGEGFNGEGTELEGLAVFEVDPSGEAGGRAAFNGDGGGVVGVEGCFGVSLVEDAGTLAVIRVVVGEKNALNRGGIDANGTEAQGGMLVVKAEVNQQARGTAFNIDAVAFASASEYANVHELEMEPTIGFEPMTCALRMRCTTSCATLAKRGVQYTKLRPKVNHKK